MLPIVDITIHKKEITSQIIFDVNLRVHTPTSRFHLSYQFDLLIIFVVEIHSFRLRAHLKLPRNFHLFASQKSKAEENRLNEVIKIHNLKTFVRAFSMQAAVYWIKSKISAYKLFEFG